MEYSQTPWTTWPAQNTGGSGGDPEFNGLYRPGAEPYRTATTRCGVVPLRAKLSWQGIQGSYYGVRRVKLMA